MTSQVVRTLEQKGLVRRATHPRDSRAKSLQGTPEGLELAKRAMILVEQTDEAFFSSLEESSACLVDLLQPLLAATDTEHPISD